MVQLASSGRFTRSSASQSPDKIAKFIEVIRNDLGIYRAVSDTKVKLSAAARADFVLGLGDIEIEQEISRADFESWIADDENFQSVAFGLVLIGLEDDLEPWLARAHRGGKNSVSIRSGQGFAVPRFKHYAERVHPTRRQ